MIVRAVRNQALLRRAWGEEDGFVLIHDEAEYQKRLAGEVHLEPVPFRKADVRLWPDHLTDKLNVRHSSEPWEEALSQLSART